MLPIISKSALLDSSSMKDSSMRDLSTALVTTRILKQHLFTPTEFQVPLLFQTTSIHQPELIRSKHVNKRDNTKEDKVLDGFCLLESVGLHLPDDAVYGVLTNKKFTRVAEADLAFFVDLLYLDISENFLALAPFGILPRLSELRLVCNDIQHIDCNTLNGPDRFCCLNFLDLSYNSLTVESIAALGCLSCLKELNLGGNRLSELPGCMHLFISLEKLLLENNKFEDSSVFYNICNIPNLREIGLAYNFLCEIPKETCTNESFKLLETLDVAFNYFGTESSVQSTLGILRLRTLFLYGNPVLGPTGEDPHYIYIEDLATAAIELHESRGGYPLEIVTEVPRKRTFKKGEDLGRRLLSYKNFQMAVAKRSSFERLGGKSSRDWLKEGSNTLFSQAVALAHMKEEEHYSGGQIKTIKEEPIVQYAPEGTFLTRASGDLYYCEEEQQNEEQEVREVIDDPRRTINEENRNRNGINSKSNSRSKSIRKVKERRLDSGRDDLADMVMDQIADDLGLSLAHSRSGVQVGKLRNKSAMTSSNSDLNIMRDRVALPETASKRAEKEREQERFLVNDEPISHSHNNHNKEMMHMNRQMKPNDSGQGRRENFVPDFLLKRSMTDAQPLNNNRLAVSTAIKALRFAMRHPLTNYSEIPAKTFLADQDHQSGTSASLNRKAGIKARNTSRANVSAAEAVASAMPSREHTAVTREGYGTGSSFAYKSYASASQKINELKAMKGTKQRDRDRHVDTLQHIDHVLDHMNASNREIRERSPYPMGGGGGPGGMGSVGSQGTTGIDNLISMVNEVVSKLAR